MSKQKKKHLHSDYYNFVGRIRLSGVKSDLMKLYLPVTKVQIQSPKAEKVKMSKFGIIDQLSLPFEIKSETIQNISHLHP